MLNPNIHRPFVRQYAYVYRYRESGIVDPCRTQRGPSSASKTFRKIAREQDNQFTATMEFVLVRQNQK